MGHSTLAESGLAFWECPPLLIVKHETKVIMNLTKFTRRCRKGFEENFVQGGL
jgi:hypothetical protein